MTINFSALKNELKEFLGDRVTSSESDCLHHGRDPAHDNSLPPNLVCYPLETSEVCKIVHCCSRVRCPVIPYGVGSSLEQQVAAPQGGVCIDLSRMDQILDVHVEDMDARVQAGVTRESLNHHLRDSGLFFPLDPGANASIGGMASTRASGTNAVRYGTMRINVMGLTVVTPQGNVIKTGGRSRKSAAGYDLTALYVGSEGTLGIITEILVKLHPVPEKISAAVVSFPSLDLTVKSVIEILQCGIPIARVELLDAIQMMAINQHSALNHPQQPTLFLEFHGGEKAVAEQVDMVRDITEMNQGSHFNWAEQAEDRNKLWHARHEAFFANRSLEPGNHILTTDVCVPISHLPQCLLETRTELDEIGLTAPIIGHVGDGNFHVMILYRDDQTDIAMSAHERLVQRALGFEGTCTGEHGIGMGKKAFLLNEHGDAVANMRSIKTLFDPDNIMNPGKIFIDK